VFTLDAGTAGNEARLRVFDLTTGRELVAIRVSLEGMGLLNGYWSSVTPESLWLEGERVHVLGGRGVRVFDGTPRKE